MIPPKLVFKRTLKLFELCPCKEDEFASIIETDDFGGAFQNVRYMHLSQNQRTVTNYALCTVLTNWKAIVLRSHQTPIISNQVLLAGWFALSGTENAEPITLVTTVSEPDRQLQDRNKRVQIRNAAYFADEEENRSFSGRRFLSLR